MSWIKVAKIWNYMFRCSRKLNISVLQMGLQQTKLFKIIRKGSKSLLAMYIYILTVVTIHFSSGMVELLSSPQTLIVSSVEAMLWFNIIASVITILHCF